MLHQLARRTVLTTTSTTVPWQRLSSANKSPVRRVLSSSAEEGGRVGKAPHQEGGGMGVGHGTRARWYQPWLSDKSLYPVIIITAATVGFALWFGPAWIYYSPVTRVDKERRQQVVYDKQEHESSPAMGSNVYTLSRHLTKEVIYPATLGAEAGSGDGMAAGEEARNVKDKSAQAKSMQEAGQGYSAGGPSGGKGGDKQK